MKVTKLKHVLFGLMILIPISTYASSINNTQISMLMIDQGHGDKVFIRTSIAHQAGNPSCHNSIWSFVLPLDTELQNKMHAMLLAAQTSGKTINLKGYGSTCNVHTGIETLQRIEYK